jgi:coenzyme F420-reducing hydrogenase beta subunit
MKEWSLEKEQYYLGKIKDVFIGYASDPSIREGAASGGIVSALLIYLLDNNVIDGTLVSRTVIKEGTLESETFIAKTREQILSCRSSIYFEFNPINPKTIGKMIKFNGRIAVVGLPCDLRILKEFCAKDEALSKKIVLTIGLFCGHNSKKELIFRVLAKKDISIEDMKSLVFRKGRWRGQTHIMLKDGTTLTFPFQHFSTYQNIYILSADKCISCSDHTSEEADIATGDIWISAMKEEPIKHSIFLSRNEKGSKILSEAIKNNILVAKSADAKTVFLSNKRSLIYHKAISARARISSLFGKKIKVTGNEPKARWNELVAVFMVIALAKLCVSERGKNFVFTLPQLIIWGYLVIFKLLTNF